MTELPTIRKLLYQIIFLWVYRIKIRVEDKARRELRATHFVSPPNTGVDR